MLNEERGNQDLAGSLPKFILTWGIPTAAMIWAVYLPPLVTAIVWIVALLWMGTACLMNAKLQLQVLTGEKLMVSLQPPICDFGWKAVDFKALNVRFLRQCGRKSMPTERSLHSHKRK